MDLICKSSKLFGHIKIPSSKSHTIRAVILAALAEGKSTVFNPLVSDDSISTLKAVGSLGVKIIQNRDNSAWQIEPPTNGLTMSENYIDVGNSGSTMYFLAPVCAVHDCFAVFTGDQSIQNRPVGHLLDALNQLGAKAVCIKMPGKNSMTEQIQCCNTKKRFPPFSVSGPIKAGNLVTDGSLSQYISGFMIACSQIPGTTQIFLKNPKEIPYLDMTKWWLKQVGVKVDISLDYKSIKIIGRQKINAFEKTIPSDWESAAFPIIAALITKTDIFIDQIDVSKTQGDEKIVEILQKAGAQIKYEGKNLDVLAVYGSRSHLELKSDLHIKLSDIPDSICAICVIACFIQGVTVLEDIEVCRKKETDRVKIMQRQLSKLGADIKDTGSSLIIRGIAGGVNLFGGIVDSFADHRVAMSLSCLGLGLKKEEKLTVKNFECSSVSFPGFIDSMTKIGSSFYPDFG
ncbi:MAG: 3-phosphoshikimate 1-carboxyvinyltransferase [Treponemataceae bacterium]